MSLYTRILRLEHLKPHNNMQGMLTAASLVSDDH
jgi:hypothetical protein